MTTTSCSGGTLTLPVSEPLIYVKNTANLGVAGRDKWAVAEGGGGIDPGLVQPIQTVVFNVGGFARRGGTLSMLFPAGKSKGTGFLTWGEGTCGFGFDIKRR